MATRTMDEIAVEAPLPEVKPRRSWRLLWLAALIVVGFALGIAATAWALGRSETLRERVLGAPPVVAVQPAPALPLGDMPNAAAQTNVEIDDLAQRLGTVESRVEEIGRQSDTVVGNIDRSEGLLLALAARRALDRGVALGYLESLLRDHFGGSDPQAVATIMAASRDPVTLETLRTGLDAIPDDALTAHEGESWWQGFRRELGSIIMIRRADEAPRQPVDRLARARHLLDDGQVDRALAEVARLPGRTAAGPWVAQARRYVTARNALDRIEMASLIKPQEVAGKGQF